MNIVLTTTTKDSDIKVLIVNWTNVKFARQVHTQDGVKTIIEFNTSQIDDRGEQRPLFVNEHVSDIYSLLCNPTTIQTIPDVSNVKQLRHRKR